MASKKWSEGTKFGKEVNLVEKWNKNEIGEIGVLEIKNLKKNGQNMIKMEKLWDVH